MLAVDHPRISCDSARGPAIDGTGASAHSRKASPKALLLVSELEDYTISYANGLARHIPVILGVPRRRYEHLTDWLDPAVDTRLLDWPRHRSPANLRFVFELSRMIRRERPNIVHLLSNTTLWLNLAAPFWRPIPLVTTVHDLQVHPGDRETSVLPSWATSLIVRQSADIIVHGSRLQRDAVAQFGKAPDRVHVLPHPTIQRYAQLARRQGLARRRDAKAFTILFFGRIFAYKGLSSLIEAEALLGEGIPNLRVVIAGRGDDPWTLRHKMGDPTRYDIRNRYIDDAEVAQAFLDADLVVLPYTEASQSGVLNVAAAFGKPAVVTDVGELGSTVEEARMGLVVPPDDPAALAQAIRSLSERRGLLAEFGLNARTWGNGPNSPEAVGARAVQLYEDIIREAGQ
jgi:glycosyltransferase involved in cell wall biosynthesis